MRNGEKEMIVKDKTDPIVEEHKKRLGLTGDVYIVEGHFIENLESHKRLDPSSKATTIEEAEQERLALIETERLIAEEMAREQEQLDNKEDE